MTSAFITAFVALCLSSCHADFNTNEYIYWKKADITAWDQYFPSRVLREELLTNQGAVAAVNSLFSGLNASLSKVVVFQAQELQTALLLMNGTEAQGCVNGITGYMSDAINQEILTYNDCAADALPDLLRLYYSWAELRKSHQASYQRALDGIDVCSKTYPNKDAVDRLKACVDALSDEYFKASNATIASLHPSPAMSYFQQVVVECVSTASRAVVNEGTQFLKMLLECSALDPIIDSTTYAQELGAWKGYNDTLAIQILEAQTKNYNQVRALEMEMISYYDLQRTALEKYVVESRGFDFYLGKVQLYLSSYYTTIGETAADNPGDLTCTTDAKASLDVVTNTSASTSLACDIAIVNNSTELILAVNTYFSNLNSLLPVIGNPAILNCFTRGYVFAPNTIIDCFDLVYTFFSLEYIDYQADIVRDVSFLSGYERTFFNGSDFPCGNSSLNRTYLEADTILYNLQRCLYMTSGTTYSVTILPSTSIMNTTPIPTPVTYPTPKITTLAPRTSTAGAPTPAPGTPAPVTVPPAPAPAPPGPAPPAPAPPAPAPAPPAPAPAPPAPAPAPPAPSPPAPAPAPPAPAPPAPAPSPPAPSPPAPSPPDSAPPAPSPPDSAPPAPSPPDSAPPAPAHVLAPAPKLTRGPYVITYPLN